MTRKLAFAAGVGLLLAVGLVATHGFKAVGDAFASVGWGVALVVAIRMVQVAGAGLSWWVLLPGATHVPAREYVWLRWIRESINTLLPVAQVGGDLVGARLLTFYGIEGGLAGASILVDLLTQTATQFVFSLVGLGLLMTRGGHETIIAAVSSGLGLMALGVVAFFFAQRWGGFRMIERGLLKLAENPNWAALAGAANLHDHIQLIHDNFPRMTAAFVLHLLMWFVGALEIWVALKFMGIEADMGEALVIESLGHAVRAAGFLVPGALGIQEGGFIALCAIYGISAPAALALSLVKRVPEILLGLPGLLYWHRLELRRPSKGPNGEVSTTTDQAV